MYNCTCTGTRVCTGTGTCLYRGGGGDFWVRKISAPPNVGALCTVAGTTVLGIHSGCTKKSFGIRTGNAKSFFGIHRIHIFFFGIRTGRKTDPGMQHTGTSTSLQKKNVSCRPREPEMARIALKISGGKLWHQFEKRIRRTTSKGRNTRTHQHRHGHRDGGAQSSFKLL